MISVDQLIPEHLRNDSVESRRRARLILYAIAVACVASLIVTAAVALIGSLQIALLVSLNFFTHFSVYLVLRISRSTVVAGHAFVWVLLSNIIFSYGADGGYNVLLTALLPLAAASLINVRGGIIWTILGILWAGFIGPFYFLPEGVNPALSFSAAILTLATGIASVIIEYTRSQAVREAEASAQRVLRQQKLLRNFAESAFKGIAEIATDGRITSCNGLSALLGYDEGIIEQRNALDHVHADNKNALRESLKTISRDGFRLEARFKHASGHWNWLEVYGIPQDEKPNEQIDWLIAARDMHEEQVSREQLAQTQRLESLGVLTGGIAHDFNNLLMVVSGSAELLPEDKLRKNILLASSEAAALTANLMALGAAPPLISSPVDVAEVLKEFEPIYRSVLRTHIKLDLHFPDERLLVMVPSSQLNQIILNLVTNAKEAITKNGSVTISLEKTSLNEQQANLLNTAIGEFVCITVSDNGAGFSDTSLSKAFDPFYSTKEKSRGSGLGLTSCYGIAQQAKGAIRIESTEGDGAKVLVYLPLVSPS